MLNINNLTQAINGRFFWRKKHRSNFTPYFAVLALNGDEGNREPLSMSMVSRLLGHGSTDITEKVYARYLPETMAEEVERLHLNDLLPQLD